MDYLEELNHQLQKHGLKEETNELGFTKDFYNFIGLGAPNDYLHRVGSSIRNQIEDMRGKTHTLRTDTATSFYTPTDDFYSSSGEGGDTWYDYGRVPISHLEVLSSKRIGVLFAACNRPATDIFDNDFEIVKISDPHGDPIENNNVNTIRRWMRKVRFNRKLMEVVDFDARTGLGHLVADKYIGEERNSDKWRMKAPNSKPESFQTFSAYYMAPTNTHQPNFLDYDKNKWKFVGGLYGANLHESRVFVYEGLREPLGLRGLALGELCWVACMCYLNLQYYILKSLAQLGTVTVGINVDREFPTTVETAKYLSLAKKMKANNFYVLGRGAQLQVQNAAGKIGSGIKEFMEFLKEDMSAAWVFPKNQLFGRAQGGGLEGAGAIVSKEDYISSNLSVKQAKIKHDILWILQEMAGFTGLEDKTIRFNIDLHKTNEQRLKEKLMEEQGKQAEMMTEQAELSQSLYRKQIKLQEKMAELQLEMLKKNPKQLMNQSEKDEENIESTLVEEPETKKDMIREFRVLKYKYDMLAKQYQDNETLLGYIHDDKKKIKNTLNRENKAYRELFKI